MRAIKKINNNVAICLDGSGKELVAFGKGIGFPKMPYNISDLDTIDRTFYNINSNYINMINDIPEDVIEFTARIVDQISQELPYELNPNLVLTLADHISFSIERMQKKIYVKMPLTYDVAQTYPDEIKLGKMIIEQISEKFHVELPQNEASGIAMNLVNARFLNKEMPTVPEKNPMDHILEDVTVIIEHKLNIQIDRNTFNYARYATHLQYLVERIKGNKELDTDNNIMYESLKKEFTNITACVDVINEYFKDKLNHSLSREEKLYLILHVNRICAKEGL